MKRSDLTPGTEYAVGGLTYTRKRHLLLSTDLWAEASRLGGQPDRVLFRRVPVSRYTRGTHVLTATARSYLGRVREGLPDWWEQEGEAFMRDRTQITAAELPEGILFEIVSLSTVRWTWAEEETRRADAKEAQQAARAVRLAAEAELAARVNAAQFAADGLAAHTGIPGISHDADTVTLTVDAARALLARLS